MNLDGARIYVEGMGVDHKYDEKIRQIVTAIKSVSPSLDVSIRLLEGQNSYEGLLWSKADEIPIGVYNRGNSLTQACTLLRPFTNGVGSVKAFRRTQ